MPVKLAIVSLSAALLVFGCGDLAADTDLDSTGQGDPVLEAALGTIHSLFDELDASFGVTSLTGVCLHSYSCGGTSVLTKTFAGCTYDMRSGVAARAQINGTTTTAFANLAACTAHRDGTALADGTTLTKTYGTDVKVTDTGRADEYTVTSTSAQTGVYNATLGQWTVTLPETLRTSLEVAYRVRTPVTTSLVFTGSRKLGTRQLSSGRVTVTDVSDTLAAVEYDVALSFLQWKDPACCMPSFGAIEVTNATSGVKTTYTFDGEVCNVATRKVGDAAEEVVTFYNGCE